MSVKKELRLVFVKQSVEALKAPVRKCIEVIKISCGSVSNENVKPLVAQKCKSADSPPL